MNYKLDHIALRSKVLSEAISYYSILAENLRRSARPAMVTISVLSTSAARRRSSWSSPKPNPASTTMLRCRRHEQSRHPTRAKDAEILREIRDADSRLTTLFVRDWRQKLVHGGANLDIVDSGA